MGELAAFARINFGITEHQFFEPGFTPRKFAALADVHKESIRRDYLPVAGLTCVYLNRYLKEGEVPITPATLYPSLFEGEAGEQSPEVAAVFAHVAIEKAAARLRSMENQQAR